jgi:hypothetical protein
MLLMLCYVCRLCLSPMACPSPSPHPGEFHRDASPSCINEFWYRYGGIWVAVVGKGFGSASDAGESNQFDLPLALTSVCSCYGSFLSGQNVHVFVGKRPCLDSVLRPFNRIVSTLHYALTNGDRFGYPLASFFAASLLLLVALLTWLSSSEVSPANTPTVLFSWFTPPLQILLTL